MKNPVTVAQALRHARHDFLNELQLIGMKLDLGREQEVKSIIRSHAEAAVQFSRLSALGMPDTEEWLVTADWRFPEFQFHLECLAEKGAVAKDGAIAEWLELFFIQLELNMGDWAENSCRISLQEDQHVFELELEMDGHRHDSELPEVPGLLAQKELAADKTRIFVSAKMEG